MKYAESAFDIIYLLIAVIAGMIILKRSKSRAGILMGISVLILGAGDAFHLVPRVLNYFISADFTAALGIGKLITSITMTVFYVLMYRIYLLCYEKAESKAVSGSVYALAALRVVLCLFPQNGWVVNESPILWAVLRNVPFVALGVLIIALYFGVRGSIKQFGRLWIYMSLSFMFYIPVAVAAGVVPMLGMLMLPKTVCYILIIIVFLRSVSGIKRA